MAINPEYLLLEGARRVDEWSQIEKKITSFDMIFTADNWIDGIDAPGRMAAGRLKCSSIHAAFLRIASGALRGPALLLGVKVTVALIAPAILGPS